MYLGPGERRFIGGRGNLGRLQFAAIPIFVSSHRDTEKGRGQRGGEGEREGREGGREGERERGRERERVCIYNLLMSETVDIMCSQIQQKNTTTTKTC